MEWRLEKDGTTTYGGPWFKSWSVPYNEFLSEMNDMVKKRYGSVNTRIYKHPLPFCRRYDQYLMVLDCDGTDEMLGAKTVLSKDGIGHTLVQSSPSHYWIITDYIANLKTVIARMRSIPGADEKHINHCANYKYLSIRGISLPGRVPLFTGTDSLKDPRAIDFYHKFEAHFQHPLIKRRLFSEIVANNIKDKTMVDMAANPEFVL